MKVYEYLVRVKEQGTDKLKQFASAAGVAQTEGEKLNRTLNRAAGSGNLVSRAMVALNRAKTTVITKLRDFGSAIVRAGARSDEYRRNVNQTARSTGALSSALGSLKNQLVTVFAVSTLLSFGNSVVATTAKAEGLRNSITFASGSAKEAAINMAFLENIANRMGLSLEASQEGFKTLSGAMMGSKLQGQATRDIFEAVSMGAAAMNLTADDTKGAFLALGQMMSKGKVSAEELKGQLGERIPGAFQIAARAMGVTTSELDDMLKKGTVLSEVFLPKFAAEMKKTFEGALPDASQSLQANINRMHNQFFLTAAFLGEQFKPVINEIVIVFGKLWKKIRDHKEVINQFASIAYSGVKTVIDILKDLIGWTKENWTAIKNLATAVAFGTGVFLAYKAGVWLTIAAFKAKTIALGAARIAALLFTGQFAKLNAIMMINPFGLVVAGIVAVAGAFVWAYNKFDWFRGGVSGLWAGFFELGVLLKDSFMKILEGIIISFGAIGDAVSKLIDFDFSGAKDAAREALRGMSIAAEGALTITNPAYLLNTYGKDIADKVKSAYGSGRESMPIDLMSMLGFNIQTMPLVPPDPTKPTDDDTTTNNILDVTSGGQRAVNLSVNIGSLVEKIEYNNESVEGTMPDLEQAFLQMFSRVLNGGLYSASQ